MAAPLKPLKKIGMWVLPGVASRLSWFRLGHNVGQLWRDATLVACRAKIDT